MTSGKPFTLSVLFWFLHANCSKFFQCAGRNSFGFRKKQVITSRHSSKIPNTGCRCGGGEFEKNICTCRSVRSSRHEQGVRIHAKVLLVLLEPLGEKRPVWHLIFCVCVLLLLIFLRTILETPAGIFSNCSSQK